MKYFIFLLLALFLLLPSKALAQVHNRPVTTASLSPSPTSLYNGFSTYSDPVTVTLTATVDTGFTATTYYKIDGGTQQTYSTPFTVTGTGQHSIEFWSVDNTGIEELNHNSVTFTINYQHAVINSLSQDGNNVDLAIHIDNIQPYLDYINVSSGGGNNCWNDLNMGFVLYNATTGAVVSSFSGQGAQRCQNIGTPSDGNQALYLDPIQLPSGTYKIYYRGGNFDWVTDSFDYTAPAPPHNSPTTNASLSPSPTSPENGLNIYSDPVTVTLSATTDTGYSIANTYYKVDGGAQQTYSTPFTITGTGKHYVEYWSVDNTGIAESPHKSVSFTINYQHGTITSLTQDGNNIDVAIHIDNIQPYLDYVNVSSGGGNNCWNDLNMGFELFNSTTGAVVSSYRGQGAARCVNVGTPSDGNQALFFDPIQLPTGTYQIHYSGGNFDWITDPFDYTAPAPAHNNPVTTATLSPSPTSQLQGLTFYSDPVTVTLSATADTGYTIANTYYKIDGGAQQTYSAPFTITGTGKHSIEYWSIDNSGISEAPHHSQSFTINYQHGVITSIDQNGISITAAIHIDNIQPYLDYINTSSGGGNNCWNDLHMSYEIYNATTGAVVSSYPVGEGSFRCQNIGTPSDGNQALYFPPLLLPVGTYIIHYSGGSFDWVTDPFVYAPSPTTTASLTTQNSDGTYSNPTIVTLSATSAIGTTVAQTYYTVDGGSQQTYSSPFTVSGGGNHVITYWSVDSIGTQESANASTFTIGSFTLGGKVYVDTNQNGVQDNGETGYNGATVTLSGATNATTTTDSSGNYSFQNLQAGSYTVAITLPTGYMTTTSNPVNIPLTATTTQNFGIVQIPQTSVTFDDINAQSPLNGVYAGINWGTNAWDVDASIATDNTHSASFHSSGVTSETFSFTNPQVLISTGIYSNSNQPALITLSCSGNSTVSQQVAANSTATLTTNWTTPCTTVTVTSSNGWNTNLDNIVYAASNNPSVTPTPTPNGQTLGNNIIGSQIDTGDTGYMNGSKFTTGATGGTAQSMTVFVGNIDNATHSQYEMAIYTNNNGMPGTLVAQTTTGNLTALSWNTLPISATLNANTTYWLMYNTNSRTAQDLNNMYYTPGTNGLAAYAKHAFGSWPTNFPAATLDTPDFSIYVIYQ